MRIITRYISLILLVFSCTAVVAVNPKRPWTFFVYIAADNNLNPEADLNISQMLKVSSNTNVYIVVHLNIKRAYENKKTQKLLIQNGKITQIGTTTVEDSGDAKTFLNAMKWAVTEYPSDHLLIDVWNHGSGPLNRNIWAQRGVCYDDSTGHYMTDLMYKNAFDVIVNQYRGGKNIDIIAFDACLMADLEVAYTLKNYAQYMIASQQTVPGPGFNYTEVLSIFNHNTPDAASFARWIVSAFEHQYGSSKLSYTLSAVDLSKLASAVSSTNEIAHQLYNYLNTGNSAKVVSVVKKSAATNACPHYDEPTYIDLYTFLANLYMNLAQMGLNTGNSAKLKSLLQNSLTNLSQCTIANVRSGDVAKSRGISIYFADVNSGIEPSYPELYWSKENPAWLNFLEEYVNRP